MNLRLEAQVRVIDVAEKVSLELMEFAVISKLKPDGERSMDRIVYEASGR